MRLSNAWRSTLCNIRAVLSVTYNTNRGIITFSCTLKVELEVHTPCNRRGGS
jgi:hypothetical protein